jgi:hypothetical protein
VHAELALDYFLLCGYDSEQDILDRTDRALSCDGAISVLGEPVASLKADAERVIESLGDLLLRVAP